MHGQACIDRRLATLESTHKTVDAHKAQSRMMLEGRTMCDACIHHACIMYNSHDTSSGHQVLGPLAQDNEGKGR